MGYRTIDAQAQKPEGLEALLQHQFGKDWKWELTINGDLNQLLADIQEGKGYAVSNSSFQAGRGTVAWIIEGQMNDNRIIGKCLSPSSDDRHSSF